tara:strand:+ start:1033 stop:1218 length:186 start_codon:yes stop_codon:yes gene_type:complete
MTYLEHWRFSLWLALRFAHASFESIVHAFLPDVFVSSSSHNVHVIDAAIRAAGCRDDGATQ